MTGIETLIMIFKILVPVVVLGLSTMIKFLWDLKTNSKEVQEEFHNFKVLFNTEIVYLKNKIDILDSKTRDSYTRSETDNLLLRMKNEFLQGIVMKKRIREED